MGPVNPRLAQNIRRELLEHSLPILFCQACRVALLPYFASNCWSKCRNEGSSGVLGSPMVFPGRTNASLFHPSRVTNLNLDASDLRLSSWRRSSLRLDFWKALAPAWISSRNTLLESSMRSLAENGGMSASAPRMASLKYRLPHSSRPSPWIKTRDRTLEIFFFFT